MTQHDIAVLGCESYNRESVEYSVQRALDLSGGPGEIVGKGRSVFIKVNALRPSPPEKGITTHPEVVRALVRQLQPVAGEIIIGDSPGGPFRPSLLKRTYEKCGFTRVAEETGALLGLNTSVKQVTVPDARKVKSIAICEAMLEADHLISVSKFKTHMLVNITAAAKNLYGAVPGMMKVTYHSRFPRAEDFADLLVDVLLAAGPCFHLVDAVVGMDGNGPSRGDIKKMGIIAAGRDALALDTVMMDLVGLAPRINRVLDAAAGRGLCPEGSSLIKTVGDDVGSLAVEGFRLPDKKDITTRIPPFLQERFGHLLSLRPVPDPGRCTGCGGCADICPAHAITVEGGVARVDSRNCIHCYCCHELCCEDAIDLERPFLMRLTRIG